AESALKEASAAKDAEISELQAKLNASSTEQQLAVAEALAAVEKQRDALENELAQAKREREADAALAQAKREADVQQAAAARDAEIKDLVAKLESIELARKLEVTEAVGVVAKERDELKNSLDRATLE